MGEAWPVIVLGARGDIGAAIVEQFRREGHPVTAVGRQEFDLQRPDEIDDVSWYTARVSTAQNDLTKQVSRKSKIRYKRT
jgi:short-subunit dehydrogenase